MRARLALLLGAALGTVTATSAGAAAGQGVVPGRVIETAEPIYPPGLAFDGVTAGEAQILLRIGPSGQLVDALATAYTDPRFAEAALRAVRQWKFAPSRIDGEPVFSDIDAAFNFRADGVVTISHLERSAEYPSASSPLAYGPVSLARLDHAPAAVSVKAPVYPKEWAEQGIKGRVVLKFYIDETGAVRLPTIVSAANPDLAVAALAAVQQWRFRPPTRQGRPVLVLAQQTFRFGEGTPAENQGS